MCNVYARLQKGPCCSTWCVCVFWLQRIDHHINLVQCKCFRKYFPDKIWCQNQRVWVKIDSFSSSIVRCLYWCTHTQIYLCMHKHSYAMKCNVNCSHISRILICWMWLNCFLHCVNVSYFVERCINFILFFYLVLLHFSMHIIRLQKWNFTFRKRKHKLCQSIFQY